MFILKGGRLWFQFAIDDIHHLPQATDSFAIEYQIQARQMCEMCVIHFQTMNGRFFNFTAFADVLEFVCSAEP